VTSRSASGSNCLKPPVLESAKCHITLGAGWTAQRQSCDAQCGRDLSDIPWDKTRFSSLTEATEACMSGKLLDDTQCTTWRDACCVRFGAQYGHQRLVVVSAIPPLPSTVERFLISIFAPAVVDTIVVALVLLGVFVHFVWWVERGAQPGVFGGSYTHGIGQAFWWGVVTMTSVGYGDRVPVTSAGRVCGMSWMFVSLLLLTSLTATMTSITTEITVLDRSEGRPKSVSDLVGVGDTVGRKRVCTTNDTASWVLSEERIGYRSTDPDFPSSIDTVVASSARDCLDFVSRGEAYAAVLPQATVAQLFTTGRWGGAESPMARELSLGPLEEEGDCPSQGMGGCRPLAAGPPVFISPVAAAFPISGAEDIADGVTEATLRWFDGVSRAIESVRAAKRTKEWRERREIDSDISGGAANGPALPSEESGATGTRGLFVFSDVNELFNQPLKSVAQGGVVESTGFFFSTDVADDAERRRLVRTAGLAGRTAAALAEASRNVTWALVGPCIAAWGAVLFYILLWAPLRAWWQTRMDALAGLGAQNRREEQATAAEAARLGLAAAFADVLNGQTRRGAMGAVASWLASGASGGSASVTTAGSFTLAARLAGKVAAATSWLTGSRPGASATTAALAAAARDTRAALAGEDAPETSRAASRVVHRDGSWWWKEALQMNPLAAKREETLADMERRVDAMGCSVLILTELARKKTEGGAGS